MFSCRNFLFIFALVIGIGVSMTVQNAIADEGSGYLGLGKPVLSGEISGWDIDVRPDGKGLPTGEGTVIDGETIYMNKCSHCHGEFGYGGGTRYPQLVGGYETLTTLDPRKTIGSYWPYASTLFDYIRRAMPTGEAQTLTNDEVYSLSAYLLYLNDIVDEDTVMNKRTLPKVVMPNVDGFIDDPRPDVITEACMKDCSMGAEITSHAKKLGVTPGQ